MRYFALILFFALLVCGQVNAATINASSPSLTHVQTALNAATYGDTVVVPAGSATWNSTVTISKGITFQGAGYDNDEDGVCESGTDTCITSGTINITPDTTSLANNYTIRVSGFYIDNNFGRYGITMGHTNFTYANALNMVRIDHNHFHECNEAAIQNGELKFGLYGVIDHCKFTDNNKHLNLYGYYSYSWAVQHSVADSRGTGYNLYIEDCTFDSSDDLYGSGIPSNSLTTVSSGYGGRWAMRYNSLYFRETDNGFYEQGADMHGNNGNPAASYCDDSDCDHFNPGDVCGSGRGCSDNRALMFAEFYGNDFYLLGTEFDGRKIVDQRGGTLYAFDNTANSSKNMMIREEDGADGICCSGSYPENWETCCDPPMRWEWNNTNIGNYELPGSDESNYVAPDYNYFEYKTSFNGTSGVGRGTLASRPATCTTGVGYWATDQGGNWNTTNGTNNDGTLYVCTSTNTWTDTYTPYTYPHPLISGEEPPDETDPTVTIDTPTTNETYDNGSDESIYISANITDNVEVSSASYSNGAVGGGSGSLSCTGTTTDKDCSGTIALVEGENPITVTGYDSSDNYSTDLITVTHTPVVLIDAPTIGSHFGANFE